MSRDTPGKFLPFQIFDIKVIESVMKSYGAIFKFKIFLKNSSYSLSDAITHSRLG